MIPPTPATLALIDSLKPAFQAMCASDALVGSSRVNLNTHRRDGSSRRTKRVAPAVRQEATDA
ncbi:hypothetical protein [Gemmatirosa kalamazoonensis]|nr:hypothetical protein [Gemmatirosa kalamazoonensis]